MCIKMIYKKRLKQKIKGAAFPILKNRNGMALVAAMLILLALTTIGIISSNTTTVDTAISGNVKDIKQAFYLADSGISYAGNFLGGKTSSQWSGYATLQNIISNQALGSGTYTVSVQDGGNNRRKVVSTGTTTSGATAQLVAFFARAGVLNVPGALYVNAGTTVQGSSAEVDGENECAGEVNPMPGIATTSSSTSSITQNGHPEIEGTPPIQTSTQVIDTLSIINARSPYANYSYSYTGAHTDTGMNWGTPTGDPATCSSTNTIYYNMNGNNTLRISGNSSGCGVLMVDGNLDIHGGLSWYGVIIVTGNLTFTGGGSDQTNITGAVIAGGSASTNTVGGSVEIEYCSTAVSNMNNTLPVTALNWMQVF